MATLRMTTPWKDPRTGIWKLRKRVPTRLRAVAGIAGGVVKLTTGTADRAEATRRWPDILQRYAAMEAEWERKAHARPITGADAERIAASWAAHIAGGFPLNIGTLEVGCASDVFEPFIFPEARTDDRVGAMRERVEFHTDEALRLAGVDATPDTRGELVRALLPAVQAAYLQADLGALGALGTNKAMRPLDVARAALPAVPDAPPPAAPKVPLSGLYDAWKAVAVVKPRTMYEVQSTVKALAKFVEHDDAAGITRDDLARWRDAMKAAGRTNNTWNNLLSLVRQVFQHGVAECLLTVNPADGLRLRKSRQTSPPPYTDAEAVQILLAARLETRPSLRWSHWIMAFTGMRAGEVLQLLGGDIRQEGDVWFIDVNESTEGKTVKTGNPRHVPIHPALITEGFVEYAQTIAAAAPVFPDKRPDRFGNRGGRAWNLIGKWARQKAGITDPEKAPDHSWRHRVEDELRAAEVPEDARDAITGHARKTTGRQYGVRGESLKRLHRHLSRIPVPAGVFPAEAPAPAVAA
jgi:integrase